MKSLELRNAMALQDESFNLPNVYAEHKGEINISSLKLNNVISAKTKKFNLSFFDSHKINFDQASIFIVDLDKIFGILPLNLFKAEAFNPSLGRGLK